MIFYDFAGAGPPGGSFEEGTEKGFNKLSHCIHFGRLFWVGFVLKSDSKAFLLVRIFMFNFGIAFARSLAAILRISRSFGGQFGGHFQHFFADAAKLEVCNPLKHITWFGGCCLRFCMAFANFLQPVLCCSQ